MKEIRTQLDTTRSATVACSDQIKQLEVNVQKVKRSKKPTDRITRYLILTLVGMCISQCYHVLIRKANLIIGMGILYLVANYRSCQVLGKLIKIIISIGPMLMFIHQQL